MRCPNHNSPKFLWCEACQPGETPLTQRRQFPVLNIPRQLGYSSGLPMHNHYYFNRTTIPFALQAISASRHSQRDDDADAASAFGRPFNQSSSVSFILHIFILISESPRGKPELLLFVKHK